MQRFVSIDGEGLTRGERHDYVLLAAEDGTYIESYDSGGLSTIDCFEYLLALGARNEGAILVGFYTSYDVNMILRDVPSETLLQLWAGNAWTWRAEGSYQAYRIEYLPNRAFKLSRGFWYWPENPDGTPLENARPRWYREASIVWWDCFQFFQTSFIKALRDWGVESASVGEIEEMKARRGMFTESERDRIRAYCALEVEQLTVLMDKVGATLDALNIQLTSWYGAGSIATALLKREGVKRHIVQDWQDEELQTAIMSAYFGGRVETFAIGVVDEGSYNYDLRSAYPAVIQDLPSLAGAVWEHVIDYESRAQWAFWRVRWKGLPPVRFTPFPYRYKKRIYWPYSGEGWYHADEVRAAVDVFGTDTIEIEVLEGYVLRTATDDKPFAWVPDVYEERAEYKRRQLPQHVILKLGLNSLYGKTAQSIGPKDGKPPPYQSYVWAGMITAWCRAQMMRAAALVPEADLLAIATDGLFTRTDIGSRLAIEDRLGAWERTEVEPGLMLIQPGVYATPSLTVAKTRGFSNEKLRYEELLEQWDLYGMAGSIEIADTRFIGFGYALATGNMNIWRTWQHGTKRIGMGGTATKFPQMDTLLDKRLVLLEAPSVPSDELSAAYVPRKRINPDSLSDFLSDFELQATSLAEQSDFGDNELSWS